MTDESGGGAGAGPAVRLEGVSRRFGWTWALRDLDLVVDRGQLVALVGPNGAGKTTLLKLLSTLIAPTSGRLEVLGRDASGEAEEIRRGVGLLAPEGYLYGELTARENLRFASHMCGIRDWERRAAAALERVGLAGAADLRVRGFSSGMERRLALARLLLRPLDLALLDEPYASLDEEGVSLVDDLVREMRREGRTVVLASHRPGRSLRDADRVVELRRGRMAWSGPPGEHAPDGVLPAGPEG